MKRPSLQFYPGDWQRNSNLRRCTHEEKGIWIDVMCVLHDQDEYGVVRWSLAELATAAGTSSKKLKALVDKDVLKGVDKNGTVEAFVYTPRSGGRDGPPVTLIGEQPGPLWYSSRMVRDEYVRATRGGSTRFGLTNSDTMPDDWKPPKPQPNHRIGDESGHGSSSASASASASANSPSLRSGDSAQKATGSRTRKRKTALQADFPGESEKQQALAYWLEHDRADIDADEESAAFRDHHLKEDKLSADWQASWRTWFRNAPKFNREGGKFGGNHRNRQRHRSETMLQAAVEIAGFGGADPPLPAQGTPRAEQGGMEAGDGGFFDGPRKLLGG